jgi:hypothetical protein
MAFRQSQLGGSATVAHGAVTAGFQRRGKGEGVILEAFTTSLDAALSACVLLTFCMQNMFRLRLTALLSNFAFIAYGWVGRLMPILVLHGMLLVINSIGLARAIRNWRNVGADHLGTSS